MSEPVDEAELTALRAALEAGLKVENCSYLRTGETVRVESGCFRGFSGFLSEFKGEWRVVIRLSLLERSVAVEVDRRWVRPEPVWSRTGRGACIERSGAMESGAGLV